MGTHSHSATLRLKPYSVFGTDHVWVFPMPCDVLLKYNYTDDTTTVSNCGVYSDGYATIQ